MRALRAAVLALTLLASMRHAAGAASPPAAGRGAAPAGADTLTEANLIQPEQLAAALKRPPARRPTVLQVGFKRFYRTGHIAGSRYAGPASTPEGLAALKQALRTGRKDQPVVLYCGCCPWEDCPNVRPAFHEARTLGYRHVEVLYIRKNLQDDWIGKGLPMRQGER